MKTLAYIFAVLTSLLAVRAGANDAHVRVNQLGYRPGDVKVAVGMARKELPAKFQVVDASTQKTVFEGDVACK